MILILEDDPDLRELVAELLEGEGYAVTTACDGVDALAKLAALDDRDLPSFLLVDLGMPRMDGVAFRLAQQGDARLRDIPLAFMSGAASSRAALQDLPLADRAEVLRKPIAIDVLLAFVGSRVRTSGVRRVSAAPSARTA